MSNVLIIAAHPDDEVLGCGIAIQQHLEKGDNVEILSLTFDKIGRYPGRPTRLLKDFADAQSALGLDGGGHYRNFPDQGLDTVRLLEINRTIEEFVLQKSIDTVYTHHYGDINKDHRITYEATITACRPTPTCPVKRLLSYWVPSSSEWMRYDDNNSFKPNIVLKASEKQLDAKIKALLAYESELRKWPHPRSIDGVRTYAKTFGMQFGVEFAEVFQLLYDRT